MKDDEVQDYIDDFGDFARSPERMEPGDGGRRIARRRRTPPD
jgi:hypothetical protein